MSRENTYVKTEWLDHIVDVTNGEVIQEGTRFTAKRMNNIEDGIVGAYGRLAQHDSDISKLRVQMEIDGRSPGNSGTFFDTFEGAPNKLTRQTASSEITEAVTAGATTLKVDNTAGFAALQQVTVFDDLAHEDVLVTAVGNGTLTVQALAKGYKKGAMVARTTAQITPQRTLGVGGWRGFKITAEVV